jgi:hypothetical protein
MPVTEKSQSRARSKDSSTDVQRKPHQDAGHLKQQFADEARLSTIRKAWKSGKSSTGDLLKEVEAAYCQPKLRQEMRRGTRVGAWCYAAQEWEAFRDLEVIAMKRPRDDSNPYTVILADDRGQRYYSAVGFVFDQTRNDDGVY